MFIHKALISSMLLIAFPAIYRSCAIRFKRDFSLFTTIWTCYRIHFSISGHLFLLLVSPTSCGQYMIIVGLFMYTHYKSDITPHWSCGSSFWCVDDWKTSRFHNILHFNYEGTLIVLPHSGHGAVWPTISSGARKFAPHSGHLNSTMFVTPIHPLIQYSYSLYDFL